MNIYCILEHAISYHDVDSMFTCFSPPPLRLLLPRLYVVKSSMWTLGSLLPDIEGLPRKVTNHILTNQWTTWAGAPHTVHLMAMT
jgi:hypothetical protein